MLVMVTSEMLETAGHMDEAERVDGCPQCFCLRAHALESLCSARQGSAQRFIKSVVPDHEAMTSG